MSNKNEIAWNYIKLYPMSRRGLYNLWRKKKEQTKKHLELEKYKTNKMVVFPHKF